MHTVIVKSWLWGAGDTAGAGTEGCSATNSMPELPGHALPDGMVDAPDPGQAGRKGDGSVPEGVLELPVQAQPDAPTVNVLGKDVQAALRRSTYDFAKCTSAPFYRNHGDLLRQ